MLESQYKVSYERLLAKPSNANSHPLTSTKFHEILSTQSLGKMLAFERGYIARFPKMEQKRAMTDSKQADSSIANSHQLTSSQLHEIFTTYFLGQKPTFERGYIAEFSILSVL